jgi:hypothetical protein
MKFEIGKTQAANIVKNKDELMKKWQGSGNMSEKRRFLKTDGLKIDQLTYEWFIKARNKNIPLSGPIVRRKAKEIAETFNANFKASEGWLEKFRIRHSITFKCISGESASVNEQDVATFAEKLPSLIRGYDPENIYNADETGLFFRALPDKTLALKREKCSGGKMSKDRLTILHCVSMAGDKEPLLVIGKSAKPRAFKKLGANSLPVDWKSNKKAWMTCQIMTEWLRQFDRKMRLQKRKILLFVDNAASHPRDLKLTNIRILFLPPNTTAMCQPLDQGIIKNFKMFYRVLILKHILAQIDTIKSVQDLTKSIDHLDAIYFVKKAWDQVTDITIKNCFSKAKFQFKDINTTTPEEFDAEDEIPLSAYAQMEKAFIAIGSSNNVDTDDFINLDDQLVFEDDDVDSATKDAALHPEEPDEEIEDDVSVDCPLKNQIDTITAAKNLKTFAKKQGDLKAYELAKNLETHYANSIFEAKRQTTLLDFFPKNL